MAGYNGWPSWEAWNVALWLGNDESLYRMAMEAIKNNDGDTDAAAITMMGKLPVKTPDGAVYTKDLVKNAIAYFAA